MDIIHFSATILCTTHIKKPMKWSKNINKVGLLPDKNYIRKTSEE